jgi:hypothetical protein
VIVTSSSDIGPAGAFWRLALWSVGTAVAALAVGAWPTYALAGDAGIAGLLWGLGIALLSALIGLVPPLLVLRAGPQQQMGGMLTGALLRFLVMLALLLASLLGGVAHRLALALWAAIGYILLLAVDTAGVIWLTKRVARRAV